MTGMPVHLTYLLSKLYAGQEATVRTTHGALDLFKIGKRVQQGCMLPLCLFNFYAVYMMQNVGVDKSHSEITRLL